MDVNENAQADYLKGAFYWHIDGTMDPLPNLAAMLSARRLAPMGGETEFANTYAAYDDLPESEKKSFEKLRVVHTFESSQRVVTPNPSPQLKAIWDTYAPKTHPLVWTHRSGRKSLVLGVTISHIEGMGETESRDLIDQLMEWTTQPKFVYRHTWTLGDLVIWDNTGVMHRAMPYALDSGRMMHRTTLLGEEPLQ
jgi:alpha-ketoglutarate-dependent taurine dioxygenase